VIIKGLKNIYNPGRFEWLSPTVLVDTANNEENIKILARMVKRIQHRNIVTLFGTTQTDPDYAAKLANMISTKHRVLIENFCDRSLPCLEYSS
jgi:folylpolyglutamate synthase/dihydropteroate synthase